MKSHGRAGGYDTTSRVGRTGRRACGTGQRRHPRSARGYRQPDGYELPVLQDTRNHTQTTGDHLTRDLPYGEHPIRLVWHKNRWHCHQPDCPKKTFTESTSQIPPRKRVTARLRAAAGRAVAEAGHTVVAATRELGLFWPVAHQAFTDHAMAALPTEPEPVAALGIDETRRGAPRFVLDPQTGVFEQVADRWHTGFVDLTGDQGLLGQVEGRSASDARSWLAARTAQWRDSVHVVAIDMCSAYRAAIAEYLPDATLVVDHFHVVQLANQVVSAVRRRVTAALRGRRVRKDDPEYGLRRRLLRNRGRT